MSIECDCGATPYDDKGHDKDCSRHPSNRRTPAAQPAPASTGRGIAEEMCSTMMGVAELKLKMAKSKEQVEAALEISGARELDVEAERLTDNEIECMWHEACLKHLSLDDSAIPDFARAIEAEVAARFRAEGGNTMGKGAGQIDPKHAETRMDAGSEVVAEAAPVSTEQAGDAWQVQKWADEWMPAFAWDHGHTIERDTFDNVADAYAALRKIGDYYSEAAFRVHPIHLDAAPSPNNSPVGADRRE